MKNKLIYGIGIVVLINAVLTAVLLFQKPEVASFGGTTNLDSLELSEDLTVTDDVTITGDATVSANLSADGGLMVGGNYDYGHEASGTFSASPICDYSLISIKPTTGSATSGDEDDYGASLSFPDDETLTAECLGSVGDFKVVYIDNTSSGSAYLDFDTTGELMDFVSKSADFTGSDLIRVEALNFDGSSISWRVEAYTDMDGD